MAPLIPIIAIIGPTGIGKTRLSVEVASAVNGEIISVDSIQVYRDCPIMAAQVTKDETKGVPHHLVDYLEVDEEPVNFVAEAVQAVKLIHSRGRIPVICGGSTSLMEPLLFHPFIQEQNFLAIALNSDLSTIKGLCDGRITSMLEDGLLNEVQKLSELEKRHNLYERPSRTGAWKSIGYPELRGWCDAKTAEEAEKALADGLEMMKQNTLQYASMQLGLMWNRLIPAMSRMQKGCIILNVVSRRTFSRDVEMPALRVCKKWLMELERENVFDSSRDNYGHGCIAVYPMESITVRATADGIAP
ncbi:adenylate isopentenyltransferase 4 [Fusarium beomiforme]|uniref:Adenylate isopentenyltransferase 4 n=1 Tax=Fusarium beomiforme TaxID=44412 RepID=A0A9P5A7X7_9HYPO|nr:adenylate isopentenyltransferase 4 [Fusarium beomiforme]